MGSSVSKSCREPTNAIKTSKDCRANVASCFHMKELIDTMNDYCVLIRNNNDRYFDELYSNSMCILNKFNHLLLHHDDDTDFEFIYKLFHKKCEFKNCKFIIRNRRNRNNSIDYDTNHLYCINNTINDEIIMIQELLDRIHCYYLHSYHIGCRLSKTERDTIYNNNNHKTHTNKNNVHLIKLYKHISNKKRIFYPAQHLELTNEHTYTNKFSSNLGKSSIINKYDEIDDTEYSYGFELFYWDNHKHINDVVDSHYYVPSKYSNLKQELISNSISIVGIKQFNIELKKASKHNSTEYALTIKADIEHYCQKLKNYPDHPCNYGYDDCYQLSVYHLLCIIVYCNYDEFQYHFSSTLRKQNKDEHIDDLIKRNSNFHFFTKYVYETVNIFGTESKNGYIKTFYHGISKNMLFKGTSPFIYGPLSTTSSFEVAMNFTNHNIGLVLELDAHPNLKYFSCPWLSAHTYEFELLFIGGFRSFIFVNITNAQLGYEYKKYIKVISIIDRMMTGNFFNDDKTIYEKLKKMKSMSPVKVGAKKLDQRFKSVVIKLINNELDIEKFKNLNDYIDNLFHYVCENKKKIIIDWKTMNIEISNEYQFGGYIGYLFLKQMFCSNNCESVNFHFINKLYPNLLRIQLQNLSVINTMILNEIFQFLSNQQSMINLIHLYLSKDILLSPMDEVNGYYANKFESIDFRINHVTHPIYHWHGIEIQKMIIQNSHFTDINCASPTAVFWR
eukprot:38200_1